jgi:hypothetical protein
MDNSDILEAVFPSVVAGGSVPEPAGSSLSDGEVDAIDDIVRLSVNLPAESAAYLKATAKKRGSTVSEVIRHAIMVAKYLQDAQAKNEAVLLERADGKQKQLVFI